MGILVALTLAAAPVGDAQATLREAVELYHRLALEKALDTLARAKASSKGPDDDVPILLYEGLIDMDLGEVRSGAAAFRSALLLRPDVQLPEKASPKVAEQFESIRAEVKAQLPKAKTVAEPPKLSPPPSPSQPLPDPVTVAPPETTAAPKPPPLHPARPFAWIPIVLGLGLSVGGGVCLGQATTQHDLLQTQFLGAMGADVARAGATFQTAGFTLLSIGVLSLALGVVLFVIKGSS